MKTKLSAQYKFHFKIFHKKKLFFLITLTPEVKVAVNIYMRIYNFLVGFESLKPLNTPLRVQCNP